MGNDMDALLAEFSTLASRPDIDAWKAKVRALYDKEYQEAAESSYQLGLLQERLKKIDDYVQLVIKDRDFLMKDNGEFRDRIEALEKENERHAERVSQLESDRSVWKAEAGRLFEERDLFRQKNARLRGALEEIGLEPYEDSDLGSLLTWVRRRAKAALSCDDSGEEKK